MNNDAAFERAVDQAADAIRGNPQNFTSAVSRAAADYGVDFHEIAQELSQRSARARSSRANAPRSPLTHQEQWRQARLNAQRRKGELR